MLRAGRPVYGVNTGMGAMSEVRLTPRQQREHQRNLLLARATGGPPWLDAADTRALIAVRLRTFLSGDAGVSAALCQRLADVLGAGLIPAVPRTGVGSAGEIVPLAQRGGHPGVTGQERAQPDRDERPRVAGTEPGRAAGRPGQQQVPLVLALLRRGEPHPGHRAHTGVHAVHRPARAQHRAGLAAALIHGPGQRGREPEPAPGGYLADQAWAEVSGRAQGAWRGRRAQPLVTLLRKM